MPLKSWARVNNFIGVGTGRFATGYFAPPDGKKQDTA